jgi:xanthine dehydrogenase accessory factor
MEEFYVAIAEALRACERIALATIVQAEGSTPRSTGTQMLVWDSGRTLGTIGGGTLEAYVVRDARQALATGRSGLHDYSLVGGEEAALGVCGGRAQVFIHVLQPPETVLIVGAGHVAQPLAQAAALAGFRVLVVDDRPEFLATERFPTAETRLISFPELCSTVPVDGHTFVVVITRSHEHDEEVLEQLLDKPVAYLGVIGSRAKVRHMFKRLREAGFADQLDRVRAPIGLDIGAETPEEIAISIVAELIQNRRGGSGLPLSQIVRNATGTEGSA